MKLNKTVLIIGLLAFATLCAQARDWAPEEFEVLSNSATPYVSMAIRKTATDLEVAFEIDPAGAPSVAVELGAGATKVAHQKLNREVPKGASGLIQLSVKIPLAQIAGAEADWDRLRLGVAVSWGGGALGQDRQRERFRHSGYGAPHGGLSPSDSDWTPLNLKEHALAVADRRNKIRISFDQPVDGKATVVIEDAAGKRVRNFISGRVYTKGPQQVEWDGLDDNGKVVAPGDYRWRSIHHPGIKPNYLFSFGNDGTPPWRTGSGTDMWGPDHSLLLTAAANGDWTFFGGSCAESGYAMVAVDQDGIKRMQYNPVMGTGIEKVCIAADATYLYAAHDGFAWGQHIDKKKPDWKGTQTISITRFEIKSGKLAEYAKGKKFAIVASNEIGPGSQNKAAIDTSLRGLAMLNGTLYISDFHAGRVIAVDPKTGDKTGEFKLAEPGALAACGADLLAVSGENVVRVAPATGQVKTLVAAGTTVPAGLVADGQQNFYVSDARSHTIRLFDKSGKQTQEFGTPGGPYAGAYQPQRLINPRGLALAANGWLWVCEQRGNPKHLCAWDTATGKMVKEKWGPTAYGASGAGFDAEDHSRWVGQGGLWNVDFAAKSATCKALLEKEHGQGHNPLMHYRFTHQDGRTFIIGMGQITSVSEILADGSQKDLAIIGQAHRFSMHSEWNPPKPFIDAFNTAYPKLIGKHADKGPGFLWTDKSGDGAMQPDEFEFSTTADGFGGGYWGHDMHDLTLRIPATVKGKRVIVVLKPEGYLAGGAPKYPALNAALAAGTPVDLERNEVETSIDRFGNMICNTDPEMKAFSPDGKLLWTYPNRWTNVHGSHNAPLPETGVMQGALFLLGMAPLDDKADVFVMNGNHGRFFVLTTDGMYLDEMFKDVRMGGALDAYLIGGECFGGMFAKSKKDGNFYLQSGHTDYRIFRLDGLAQATRGGGALQVKPEQIVAAERALANQVARKSAKKEFTAAFASKAPKIDGKDEDWTGATIQWDKSGQFLVGARVAYDATMLYLYYNVADNSPWVNSGKESTLLFKTGDSVDIQLGTDAGANGLRSQPVPGDLRVLIAPFENKNIAVLYRHRLGAKDNPITFVCPWRSETVDSVKILEKARIAVLKENNRYHVEAAIPLADLGLNETSGKTIKGDVGVIYGDPAGQINMLRSYWSNQNTGLVNDVPGEIMLSPNLWGTLTFQKN